MKWCIVLICLTTASGFFHTASFINQKIRSYLPKNKKKNNIQEKVVDEQTIIDNAIQKFDMSWYVVAEKNEIHSKKPYKVTVWGKDYVIWKTDQQRYTALEDVCPHKGAAFSVGTIENGRIVCPYHGYEFDKIGNLTVVPGLCFQPSPIYNVARFAVVEKNGWIYLNTWEVLSTTTDEDIRSFADRIFVEPEIENQETEGRPASGNPYRNKMKVLFINQVFKIYPRVVTENSLDIMHIAFVHTFGNAKRPEPIREIPPALVGPNHYRSTYFYEAGEESVARKVFGVKELVIENEFILPHTTIARVIFGDFVSTVMTFALPIGENKSRLFVKTYRNFWQNQLGDMFTSNSMLSTMLQDKAVVESIDSRFMDGKFNMKFDKLQNTYVAFYKRFVHLMDKEN